MSKRIFLTLLNLLICLAVLLWFITAPRQAGADDEPEPFLGPIYYGSSAVLAVFDHDKPLWGTGDDDGNEDVRHYDGTLYQDPIPAGYGFNMHNGIDYDLDYQVVLAAADGLVQRAGWSNPADHTQGVGLRVVMSHQSGGNLYQTRYGHLSVITVKPGDQVIVDPAEREGIIGISGATGDSEGPQLHFELRLWKNNKYRVVNPYGWAGTSGQDPWANASGGADSYDLWLTYPNITSLQYPSDSAVSEPAPPVAARTIDDSDSDFTNPEGCMTAGNGNAFNGTFHATTTVTSTQASGACFVKWYITDNELTPAGDYDLYVHIPAAVASPVTRGAVYTIRHDGQTARAIVVQEAYASSTWVYLGRYAFNMASNQAEYVQLSNVTFADDGDRYIAADAIQLAPVNPAGTITPTPTTTATATPFPSPTPSPTGSSTPPTPPPTPPPPPTQPPPFWEEPAAIIYDSGEPGDPNIGIIGPVDADGNPLVTCYISGNALTCTGTVEEGNEAEDHGATIQFYPYAGSGFVVGFALTQVESFQLTQYKTADMLGRNGAYETEPFVDLKRCYGPTETMPPEWAQLGCDQYANKFNPATLFASFTGNQPPSAPTGFAFTFGNFAWLLSAPPIAEGQDWNVECPFCSVADTQGIIDGLNTRTGNFSYLETALAMPVLGNSLAFRYGYISAARDIYTTTMGYGWVHNYDMQLHFASTAMTHTVVLQAPGGSRFPYTGNGDGTYARYPGVTADLVRNDVESATSYVITTFNQYVFTFNAEGKLTEAKDPFGNTIDFTYQSGRLYRATQGSRFLQYSYDGSGRLATVTDNESRTVTLAYAGNDLASVTALGRTTHYEYDGGPNLLTEIIDPSGRTLKRIEYDEEDRAYRLWEGNDLVVDVTYPDDPPLHGPTSGSLMPVTSGVVASGVVMTHSYGLRGTLIGTTYACPGEAGVTGCGRTTQAGHDYNFRANQVSDANGHSSSLTWNLGGSNLEQGSDALDNTTYLSYDLFNSLTQTVNARGYTTTYGYHNPLLPTFRTHITDTLGHTTLYTATAEGLLAAEQDPSGRVITYTYNTFGQVVEMVQAAGTTAAITTTYGYDDVGRLMTTTQTSAAESHTTLNVYDEAGQLAATIDNWTGSDPGDWDEECDLSAGPRDTNVCTQYEYDDAGRTISTTNSLGQVNLTFYNEAGRVVTSVVNYDNTTPFATLCTSFAHPDPEANICALTVYDQYGRVVTTTDSLGRQRVTQYNIVGRVSSTIVNYDDGVFNSADPDTDIITHYEYDAVGNTLIVTDTLNRMAHTFYDPLNRVAGTITNWSGPAITLENCLELPALRDDDICTLYSYDEVGNTLFVTDTLTHTTRTFYNGLDQTVATVRNWTPALDSPADCVISPANLAVENICTLYGYDAAGRQITVTNALSQTTLTVYDEANRPFLTVKNWDGTPIEGVGDCDFPPAKSNTNLCSFSEYDELGRRLRTTDPMGNSTEFTYDGLGRVITTTHYLDGLPVPTASIYDALGNRLGQVNAEGATTSYSYDGRNRVITTTTAEGVETIQFYDAASQVLTTTDSLGHRTSYTYDDLGRRLTTRDAEDNTTTYVYDALGNQTAVIDAEGIKTSYVYDELNRLVQTIENDTASTTQTNERDIVTLYSYDAIGNRVVITNARDSSTLTTYDALYRPVIVEDALGHRTYIQYNALGHQVVVTDANEAVTRYAYDGLNRTTLITYTADNETVRYGYDAAGHRTIMTDTLGTTRYVYDDLYRLITVTNPFTGTVGYGYDLVGNRTHLTYPDGKVVSYTYDLDNRLVQVEDWEHGLTTYGYDPAGRLITTTLPNGVVTVNAYDDANRLIDLSHTISATAMLLAHYQYQLDGVGNWVVVTETVRGPNSLTLTLTLSPPITVTAVVSNQQDAAVAYNSLDQEYLVAWQSQVSSPGDAGDIYARLLDDSGVTIGSSFAVVTTTKTEQDPAVAYSPNAETFLVTWTGTPATSTQTAVYGRLLTSDGQLATGAFILDSSGSNPRSSADVIYDPVSNQFLVIWMRKTGSDQDLFAAFVHAATGTAGSAFAVANSDTPTTTVEFIPKLATDGAGAFLAVWRRGSTTQDIFGQLFNSSGLVGGVITITNVAGVQTDPTVSFDQASDQYLVSWEDNRSGGQVIYGQFIASDGTLLGSNFPLIPDEGPGEPGRPDEAPLDNHYLVGYDQSGNAYLDLVDSQGMVVSETVLSNLSNLQNRVALASDTHSAALAAWESNHGSQGYDIYARVITGTYPFAPLQTTTIVYDYDPLHRLTEAAYTGALTATYGYGYDPVGNRLVYTATITTTAVITYHYDAANRLIDSKLQGGPLTTYQWDDAGRLITTTVGGVMSRVYQYSQDGDLITATVGSQVTTFAYDGNGNRLLMSVAGDTITYTLDYARGRRVLLEIGETSSDTKHYLYGVQCIAEVVAADEPAEKKWRYYHRDGKQMVRQTTDDEAEITLAWVYTPEGAVLMGEEGPVTNLDCGTGAIYDWSTGLIFKDGRYFDPRVGVWLTMMPFLVWQLWKPKKQRRKAKSNRHLILFGILILLVMFALVGCQVSGQGEPGEPTQEPTETPCPTETPVPPPPDATLVVPVYFVLFYDGYDGGCDCAVERDYSRYGEPQTLVNDINTVYARNDVGIEVELRDTLEVDRETTAKVLRYPLLNPDINDGNSYIFNRGDSDQPRVISKVGPPIVGYEHPAKGLSGGTITAYFFSTITPFKIAEAFVPKDALPAYDPPTFRGNFPTAQAGIIINPGWVVGFNQGNIVAHEVGHLLGLDHDSDDGDTNNLMHGGTGDLVLNGHQIATMRNNAAFYGGYIKP